MTSSITNQPPMMHVVSPENDGRVSPEQDRIFEIAGTVIFGLATAGFIAGAAVAFVSGAPLIGAFCVTGIIVSGFVCSTAALSSDVSRRIVRERAEEKLLDTSSKTTLAAAPRFQVYADNWSFWSLKKYPTIPHGVSGDVAFAVVKPDGTFDSRWPVEPGAHWKQGYPDNCDGLAIGGWNNSFKDGGLFAVMHGPQEARDKLQETILDAIDSQGFLSVTLDYEDYSHTMTKDTAYTDFLVSLGEKLHAKGIRLQIAISPDKANEDFYSFDTLEETGAIDCYHVMCYDYARGLTPITVQPNASVAQTMEYLEKLSTKVDPSKISVGVPFYALGYELTTPGMSPEEVLQGINEGNLSASYKNINGDTILDNDKLIEEIGDWNTPTNGYVKLIDDKGNYFYYQQSTGTVFSAFPPNAITHLVSNVTTSFPSIDKYFAWEAASDAKGSMMSTLVETVTGKAPAVPEELAEVWSAAESWLTTCMKDMDGKDVPPLAKWSTTLVNLSSSKKDLAKRVNVWITGPGKGVYASATPEVKAKFNQLFDLPETKSETELHKERLAEVGLATTML